MTLKLLKIYKDHSHVELLFCKLPLLSYTDRLEFFNLKRLELRRIHFDLIELFKIVNGWSTSVLRSIVSVSNITFTRGHRFKLFVPFICKNMCKSYFLYRAIPTWNALLQPCFNTNIIRCFNNRIACFNFENSLDGRQ